MPADGTGAGLATDLNWALTGNMSDDGSGSGWGGNGFSAGFNAYIKVVGFWGSVWNDYSSTAKGTDKKIGVSDGNVVSQQTLPKNNTGYYIDSHGVFRKYDPGTVTSTGAIPGTYEDYLKQEKPDAPNGGTQFATPQSVMSSGLMTAGAIVVVGGGVEDVPADFLALGRIGASFVEAGALWAIASYTANPAPTIQDNSAYKDQLHYTIPDPTNSPNNINIDPNNNLPESSGVVKLIIAGGVIYEIYDNYQSIIPAKPLVSPVDGTYVVPVIQPSK